MKKEQFLRHLERPSRINVLVAAELQEVATRYPWFITARVMAARVRETADPVLALHLMNRPCPSLLLEKPAKSEFTKRDTEEIIEDFLSLGHVRIKPPEEATKMKDISAASVEEDPVLISEEIAAIYLSQGLNAKAAETYRKLSLLYPEKSVYFAELIAEVEHDMLARQNDEPPVGGEAETGFPKGILAAMNLPRDINIEAGESEEPGPE